MKFFKIPKLHLNSRECQEMFLESFILTRMLVFVSKSHRKGLGKHGKNIKTKFR